MRRKQIPVEAAVVICLLVVLMLALAACSQGSRPTLSGLAPAPALGVTIDKGDLVIGVEAGSSVDKAGIKIGDEIQTGLIKKAS